VTTFAVIRDAGPAWALGGIYGQPDVDKHAAYMEALAARGSLLLAGPLNGSEGGRVRVLLVFEAQDEADIHRQLGADPWAKTGQLNTTRVEPWKLLVGAERLQTRAIPRP
jgi:uncharacterized protein YciI